MLDEFLIEIHPIGQDHVSKDACVLAVAVFFRQGFFYSLNVAAQRRRFAVRWSGGLDLPSDEVIGVTEDKDGNIRADEQAHRLPRLPLYAFDFSF